jgi:phosphatidylserine decarboxylase
VSFAREGVAFIVVAVTATVVVLMLALAGGSTALWVLTAVLGLLSVWIAWFFRDPERTGPRSADLIISPADGKVVMIAEVDEPAFIHGRAMRVSIFMNVLNVHVNRYSISGRVRYVHYNKGKFLNAMSEKSSLDNEQMSVGTELDGRRVLVRQIAGFIARRIVNYSREGDTVQQGERMGLIRFGSRVDVFAPVETDLRVAVGDNTTAGVTVIGAFRT